MTAVSKTALCALLGLMATYLQGCTLCVAGYGPGCGPPAVICAQEGLMNDCKCKGTVYYGAKYVDGKPGKGAVTTITQMMARDYKAANTKKGLLCNSLVFLGDPVKGYSKHCYCQASNTTVPGDKTYAPAMARLYNTEIIDTRSANFMPTFGLGFLACLFTMTGVFVTINRMRSRRAGLEANVADSNSEFQIDENGLE